MEGGQTEQPVRPLLSRIGDALRQRREASTTMTQEGFADHIRMHRSYYGEIERGRKDLKVTTLERVCGGLKVPMSVILSDAESMT